MFHILTLETAYSRILTLEKGQTVSSTKIEHSFQILPVCLYQVIQNYVSQIDYLSFMNTSKELFQQIKYETIDYSLDGVYSKLYYYNLPFRQYLLKHIKNPSKQLSLTFYTYEYSSPSFDITVIKNVHRIFLSYGCQITSINTLNQGIEFIEMSGMKKLTNFDGLSERLQGMKLSRFPNLNNVNGLKHLKELELHNCPNITDVKPLKELKKLTIIGCNLIKDISSLNRIEQLSLISCLGINDVSSLNHVKDLSLHYCNNINNIDRLQDHEKISIIGCQNIIDYEKCLKRTKDIHISNFPLTVIDIFPQANHLTLSHSDALVKIEKLPPTLKTIHISHCSQIKDVSSFTMLYSVTIDHCDYVSDIGMLGNVHTLVLSWLHKLTSLGGLGCRFSLDGADSPHAKMQKRFARHISGNFSVTIISCPHIKSFRPLAYVPYVTIDSCLSFRNSQDLENVQHLIIKSCEKLENINYFCNIQDLTLIGCHSIRNIQSLSNVPYLTISDCSKIDDYYRLENNQKIVIDNITSTTKLPTFHGSNGSNFNYTGGMNHDDSFLSSSPTDRKIFSALDSNSVYSCIPMKKKRIYLRKSTVEMKREAANIPEILKSFIVR